MTFTPAKRRTALGLCVLLIVSMLAGCGGKKQQTISYKVIGELDSEEFRVAFRKDDPLCEIITAAMQELAYEGKLSYLCTQYLGTDYSCMPAIGEALRGIGVEVTPGRRLRIGVQDGVAPLSSSREDGSFSGLIPDLAEMVAEKLGWTFEYMVINSDSVAAELGSGNIDCAWMAASFAESESSCSLSPGWLRNSHQIVVRSGTGISRKSGLKQKIVGITDVTSLNALKADGIFEKITSVWYYEDLNACFSALIAGDCDAVIIDSIVSAYYI